MNEHETLEAIWGNKLLDEGFLGIPNVIVRNYRKLGIEHGEFGLVCTILTYKHDTRDPYPSHEKLADHMKCSERQVRKWIDSLESKSLLRVGRRMNNKSKQFGNMIYNFNPLINAALKLVNGSELREENDWDIVYKPLEPEVPVEDKNPVEPEVPLAHPLEPEVPNPLEPQVPLNRSFEYNLSSNTINTINTIQKLDELLHERLETMFSRSTYESWFADVHVHKVDSQNTYIASPVEFVLRFLEERHTNTLREILEDLTGNPGEIKFILLE